MKKRDFILVLLLVAIVALLFSTKEPEDSIPLATPPIEKTAGPSPVTTPSEKPSAQVVTEFECVTDCDFGTGEVPDPPEKTDALLLIGKKAYLQNCALCHGLNLDGTGDGGRSLLPPPTDLGLSKNFKYGSDSRSIYRVAAYGIEGTGCAPWDGIITPHDMWAISFYIESRLDRR